MKVLAILAISLLGLASAKAATITVEIRNRPPDLIVEDGRISGPVFHLVEAIMAETGNTARYVTVPWKRSIVLAQQGKAGMLIRHSMDEDRAAFLSPMPYGYERREVSFIRRKDGDADPRSFDDLAPYLIGHRAGAYYYPRFNESGQLRKIEATDEKILIKMLAAGRIDLVISDNSSLFRENAEAAGLPFDGHFEPAPYKEVLLNGRYFSVPRTGDHARYFEDLNCAIYQLRVNGTVDRIFIAAGLEPPIQAFNEPHSQAQMAACS
ncbi:hypothetical protein GCM10011316_35920 [Roseibium aquae]|uniref:Solute-binding protein family 3/N-terminal domain-containing protein n=1 Tax=Roseibium aquae TaxID=1323746 RepID=A0A916TNH7_9HYPH|nr:ABC transporter substrate-binding protein [Roseibium aquae]GGB60716.1 hypothetical protein GCM10011316_35920 [Roseibium aquae]